MLNFLTGGGRMVEAILAYDWSHHPLGPPADWPPTLKTTVAVVLASRFPQCIFWGEHLTNIPNDAFVPLLGQKPPALGRPLNAVWPEIWDDIEPIIARAFAGESTFIENFPLTVLRGEEPEEAWFTFSYSPIRDERGKVVGVIDTVVETTSTVRARQQSDIITRELVHRVKNALAIAQSITSQSLRGDVSLAEARTRLDNRFIAMARTQDILLNAQWDEADVSAIVDYILKPHLDHADRVTCSGPTVTVSGPQTLSLALALHELATNAAKYGALAEASGQIAVSWAIDADADGDTFSFTWSERGGPPVIAPDSTGFGSQILTRVLPADFSGKGKLHYHSGGLRYVLTGPAQALPAQGRN